MNASNQVKQQVARRVGFPCDAVRGMIANTREQQ
jgi:hypothetical protein